jgi:hypothetical protein
MSKSPQTANRVTRLYDLPSRSLPVDPRDRRDIGHDGLKRAPRLDGADVMPARLDRQDTTPWPSSILAFFIEGFALYAAFFWHARRRAMAIVSSAMYSGVAELEDDINRAAPGSETASGHTSFDAGRSNGRSWLTKRWHAIAGRWAQGRREREIKKAFAALVEADRRTSRNFGIPHRSRIEQVARYRRDC